jgi:hypothetical protein
MGWEDAGSGVPALFPSYEAWETALLCCDQLSVQTQLKLSRIPALGVWNTVLGIGGAWHLTGEGGEECL